MAKHRQKHGGHAEHENGEAWLLPYSDLMTLLLAVFIVLFAVSKVDEQKAKAISSAFSGIFEGGAHIVPGGSGTASELPLNIVWPDITAIDTTPPPVTPSPEEAAREDKLRSIQLELETYLQQEGLNEAVVAHIDERGLVISLNSSILFDSASVQMRPETRAVLVEIGSIICNIDAYIRVEGHTDNRPISSAIYPSNWELSAARAISVIKLFITESGITPDRLVAVGYGEFKPVADNDTDEGRARNRRVDIIILDKKFDSLEDQGLDGGL